MIGRINRLGLWTLYMKEVRRFFKVQTQTIWAPAITTLLQLVIFTVALGREGRAVSLWARDVGDMAKTRQNERHLPGVTLPESVSISAE